MLKARPRDIQKDYKPEGLVTNSNPLASDNSFTLDGVFSDKIFGNLANSVDYSCECGHYQVAFNAGHICEKCNTPVVYKGLQLSKEGWIDLQELMIHPVFFRYFQKIIGKTAFDDILNYRLKININGSTCSPALEPPYKGIGLSSFIENYEEICSYFLTKKKDPLKQKDFIFIQENIGLVFIDKFPIINSRLRPGTVINGVFQFDEINNLYNIIVKNSGILSSFTEIEKTEGNIQSLLYKSQNLINNIFSTILDTLSNKEGFIRNSLVGNRLNLSARNVIAPLSSGFSMDECLLPYKTSVELLKPLIIRKIQKIKKISLKAANKLWFEATLEYNKFIHTIMNEIAKEDNVKIILNRNPTINVGSEVLLNFQVKEDINDLTISISNLILPLLGADYDGDVLNVLLIVSKRFVDMFSLFMPSNLVIDCDTGMFNQAFKPFKDIEVGLESLR